MAVLLTLSRGVRGEEENEEEKKKNKKVVAVVCYLTTLSTAKIIQSQW
jgi:hypothetical protein